MFSKIYNKIFGSSFSNFPERRGCLIFRKSGSCVFVCNDVRNSSPGSQSRFRNQARSSSLPLYFSRNAAKVPLSSASRIFAISSL